MSLDNWTRRGFIRRCAAGVAGFCAVDAFPLSDSLPRVALAEDVFDFSAPGEGNTGLSDYRAAHWELLDEIRIICRLCPRECRIADQERGYCGVRENQAGVLKTLVHSRVCAVHADPIEKKPLFHVWPGTKAFSIATAGCNIQCKFCQNWEISQFRPEQVQSIDAPPERVVAAAQEAGCRSIASTYSEPVVFWEFVRDIADAGNENGVRSVIVSSGYIKDKPLRELIPRLAAVKIDLKGFTEKYYHEICSGELAPVLRTLEILKETGIWFEIVV
jgi:pyruvate formate lyase activating enzyme